MSLLLPPAVHRAQDERTPTRLLVQQKKVMGFSKYPPRNLLCCLSLDNNPKLVYSNSRTYGTKGILQIGNAISALSHANSVKPLDHFLLYFFSAEIKRGSPTVFSIKF